MNVYVPGRGNGNNPKIAIIGEAPSFEEEEKLTPFVGPSGRFLDKILDNAGIDRSACWITNACKFMVVPQSKVGHKLPFVQRAAAAGIDLQAQLNELRIELNQVRPNLILALGGSALWAVTGHHKIQEYRGSILQGMNGIKTIGTYHPAHFLHMEGEVTGYWQKFVMEFDIRRAKVQSSFPDIRRPYRNLNICRNAAQLYDFIRRNSSNHHPSIDIEANNTCIPVCVGISFQPNEGITVPLWSGNISNISDTDLAGMWILLSNLLAKNRVIGQNFGYDRDKLKRLGFIIKGLFSDTMIKSFAINPELPKNLAFNTSIYTEEPFYKNEGMYEGSIEDLMIGCARDACVTKEIDNKMDADLDEFNQRPFYENFLLKLHDLYSYVESNGILVDESRREEIIRKYITWSERVKYQIFEIAGDFINSASPKQVSSLLYDNWQLPYKGGTGEEVLTQILNGRHASVLQKKCIELILTDRRLRKTIGTYLLTPTDYDGRMRTSYFICLETGRTSTNQQEPPIRPNIEVVRTGDDGKNKKQKVSMGCAFQTLTKHGDIGPEVRTMYVPSPGYIFIQADSAQAEARVTALLADDMDMLERYDKIDVHAWTAALFFNKSIEEFDKKIIGYEKPERFIGKTLRHAGERGMKRRRASIEVNTSAKKYGVNIVMSEGEADRHLKSLHRFYPKLEQVYFRGIQECLEKNKRRLVSSIPYGISAEIGGIRTFYERWGDELFRQAYSYIPQRAVTDNTKAAALRIHQKAGWIKILVESHDSLLCEVEIERLNEAVPILIEEMERPIDFTNCSLSRGMLSIPCEIETGYNYKELSKFRMGD